jgi:hypothetical protein
VYCSVGLHHVILADVRSDFLEDGLSGKSLSVVKVQKMEDGFVVESAVADGEAA